MLKRHQPRGFSFVSLAVSLLIAFALLAIYLKQVTPDGTKNGPPATALDAARRQAQNFEAEQKKRLEQMDQIGR